MRIPTVKLAGAPPRQAGAIKRQVDLHVHLRPVYALGGVCLAVGLGLMATFGPRVVAGHGSVPNAGAVGLGLGLVIIGGGLVLGALARWRARLRALTHGRLVQARVVGHATEPGRRWLLLRGRDQHVVRVELPEGARRGEFRSPFAMAEALPVGSEVAALVDVERGTLAFPHELLVGVEADG